MQPSVTLGVTGSIAAYRAADLARELGRRGCRVSVVMTESACRFVAPLTFETLTGQPVYTSLWNSPLSHIELARSTAVVVAPATANILSKAALGLADDLLSTLLLAASGNVIFAPSMNWRMYRNPVVQKHVRELCDRGWRMVPPGEGTLACGEEGEGRLADLREIVLQVERAVTTEDMKGRRVLVTSGPTREPLDPVRFISNRSSGKMGMAMASEAYRRGAQVTLITGPTHEYVPSVFETVRVETAKQMHAAVKTYINHADMAVMVAAVSDYSPETLSTEKLVRQKGTLTLELSPTVDILREVGRKGNKPFLVGFSAETGARLERAVEKMKAKGADVMVFNDVTREGAGFDVDTNEVTLLYPDSPAEALPAGPKPEVAKEIFNRILNRLA